MKNMNKLNKIKIEITQNHVFIVRHELFIHEY